MIMRRAMTLKLAHWMDAHDRLPLLVRGARQVGKTHTVVDFGEQHFDSFLKVNFEKQPEYRACFETLQPEKILQKLFTFSGQTVVPGKTLLFLDEIQECPNAILALRYFYEEMPNLHVVAAGSLLEFTMRQSDFRMPVGRVQSYYLKPLSFNEFLVAVGKQSLLEYMKSVTLREGIDPHVHEQLLGQLKEYFLLGGMPAVLNQYIATQDMAECQLRQNAILEAYQLDFAKYSQAGDLKYLQTIFDKAPGMVAQHMRYTKIDPDSHSRDLKRAIQDLKDAGVLYTVHASNGAGVPLINTINERKYKLLFLDVGLVNNKTRLSSQTLLSDDLITLHQGALAEQFVGQELLAYASIHHNEQLYYWEREKRTSTAEVDYLFAMDTTVYPLEVKAGATGRLRSLKLFVEEKGLDFGIRISQNLLSFERGVLSVPLYMISELPRLIQSI